MIARSAARALTLVGVALALLGAGRAPASTQSLLPRSQMLTVDELRPGMKGVGKSVFRGTKVEDFGVTVIGVLRKVDFDGDIILIRIDSGPPVSQGFGVVAGMSGSPIYVKGKLIGALAYAWAFAKQPIAGVTPIAQMLEAFQPGSSPVRRQGSLRAAQPFLLNGQRIERGVVYASGSAVRTGAPNTAALVPIATPVLVSGLSPRLIEGLRRALAPMGLIPVGAGGSAGRVETRMVPGQAVGAQLVGGDLDLTAVGTVTYVKGDVVIAFGHPMASLGSTDVPLVAAYVHGVMPSAELSFKLASGGQALGRFTEDRPWCIGGRLGGKARVIDTKLRVTDLDRGVARDYTVGVIQNRSLTSMLLVLVLGAAVDSIGPPVEGTTRASFSLEAEGLPPLHRENTYTVDGGGGILALLFGGMGAESATGELSQMLEALRNSEFGEARLDRVGVEVELSKARRLARVEDVYLRTPKVRAGDEVDLTVTLRASNGGLTTRTEKIRIPANCPPGTVRVGVAGGRSAEQLRSRLAISEPRAVSLAQMVEQMLARPGNDDLVIDLAFPTVGIEARGFAFRDLPPAAIEVLRSPVANRLRPLRDYAEQRARTEWVLSGTAVLNLIVEGDEKDKAGRLPSPQYEPPRYEQTGGGLASVLFGTEGDDSARRAADMLRAGEEEKEEEPVDLESPPPMPSWEEVETVDERELTTPAAAEGEKPAKGERGKAVGRVASVWRLSDPKELLEGKADGTAILSTGGLTLAPAPRDFARIEARCVWPLAVAADGSVYTGSWTDGVLRRTTPEGATTEVLKTQEAAIQAVAAGPDDTIYAASAPGGAIYRLSTGQEAKQICRLDVQNVWALAVAPSGEIWVATGPQGKLYRISPDGVATLAFTAADRHITCLARGAEGTVYAGTSPLGKVYALSPEGGARSVYEVDKAAIQSLAVDAAGNVFLGLSPEARVLKLTRDGGAREVLKLKGKHVLALLAKADGVVYAATGPEAKVTAIYPDESTALIYDGKTAFIAALASDSAGNILLTAADSGRVVKLDSATSRTASYSSNPKDAGATAKWGAVRARGDLPTGSDLRIWTRTGETAYPDATWSPWAQTRLPAGGQAGDSVVSPPGRFLQCRLDLSGSGAAAPRIEAVEFVYLPVNRGPSVRLTSPRDAEIWSGPQTIRWSGSDPDQDRLAYEVYWSSDRGQTWTRIETPTGAAEEEETGKGTGEKDKPEVRTSDEKGEEPAAGTKPAASGKVSKQELDILGNGLRLGAPEEDQDTAALIEELMAAGEPPQVQGEEEEAGEEPRERVSAPPSRATSAKWDTSKVADGLYLIKVIASDERANPGDPRKAEVISPSVLIDNTPPELILDRNRKEDEAPPAAISAFDRASYVTSAEFKVDEGEWLAALPADGIFDGQYEVIAVDLARLPQGSHALALRVRDAAGNVAEKTLQYKR